MVTDDAQRTTTEVPWSWRAWLRAFDVLAVLGALFLAAIIVWFLARPIGHIAADTVQRWNQGWQEGLDDGPN